MWPMLKMMMHTRVGVGHAGLCAISYVYSARLKKHDKLLSHRPVCLSPDPYIIKIKHAPIGEKLIIRHPSLWKAKMWHCLFNHSFDIVVLKDSQTIRWYGWLRNLEISMPKTWKGVECGLLGVMPKNRGIMRIRHARNVERTYHLLLVISNHLLTNVPCWIPWDSSTLHLHWPKPIKHRWCKGSKHFREFHSR